MEESYSVAGEEEVAESAVADEAGEWEENTVVRIEEEEFVPEMAEGYNRFEMKLVEEVDSVLEPLVPSCVGGLVKLREVELEAERGWPALGNPGGSIKKEIVIEVGKDLGSSDDEDVIIGGVIVAGGASQKAKNTARRAKKKATGVKLLVGFVVGKLILFGHA